MSNIQETLLSKLTIVQLTSELDAHGVSLKGRPRKAEIIQRVVEVLKESPPKTELVRNVIGELKKTGKWTLCEIFELSESKRAVLARTYQVNEPRVRESERNRGEVIERGGWSPEFGIAIALAGRDELIGFRGEIRNFKVLATYSVQELKNLLRSQGERPNGRLPQDLIPQFWEKDLNVVRESYTVSDLASFRKSDWLALGYLWKDPLVKLDALMKPPGILSQMGFEQKHFSDTKLVELAEKVYGIDPNFSISRLSEIAPKRLLAEFESFRVGRNLESEVSISDLLKMTSPDLRALLEGRGFSINLSLVLQDGVAINRDALMAAAVYTVVPSTLVKRRPESHEEVSTHEYAIQLALRGIRVPIRLIQMPDYFDRTLFAEEITLLSEYENFVDFPVYRELRGLNANQIRAGMKMIGVESTEVLTHPQLLFLIAHRNLPEGLQTKHALQKMVEISQLLPEEQSALMAFHRTDAFEMLAQNTSLLVQRTEVAPDTVLAEFFSLRKSGKLDLVFEKAQKLGIRVPPIVDSGFSQQYLYILNTVARLGPYFSRRRPVSECEIEELSDQEIFDLFGLMPFYSSRQELVQVFSQEVDTFWKILDPKRIKNQTPISCLEHEDLPEKEVRYAYGSPRNWKWVSTTDLLDALENASGEVIPSPFHNDSSLWKVFPLFLLAQSIKDSHTATLILGLISKDVDFDPRRLSEEDQKDLKSWLKLLWETAMYMRRWRGSGYSYPLSEGQTHANNGFEARVSDGLYLLESRIEKFNKSLQNYIKNMRVELIVYGAKFNLVDQLKKIKAGDYCIRTGSKEVASSVLFDYKRLGLQIKDPVTQQVITIEMIASIS